MNTRDAKSYERAHVAVAAGARYAHDSEVIERWGDVQILLFTRHSSLNEGGTAEIEPSSL